MYIGCCCVYTSEDLREPAASMNAKTDNVMMGADDRNGRWREWVGWHWMGMPRYGRHGVLTV